ncbi:MAG: IscS subfamily cysteine desulfurase [Phycisphaerae bacterium]|nr:IscS subfamily cysteine desulfurase [Phycisphaerae bacterium]
MPEELRLPVYLDYQATTPVDPRVLEAMTPYFSRVFGNAASKNHAFGRDAHRAVETARETIGAGLHAKPQDICFTSGATEAINLAIKGVFYAHRDKKPHFVTVVTEHKAVLDSMKRIESEGAQVTYLRADAKGMLDPAAVAQAIRAETILVSVMAANNEIGVIQPLGEIGRVCRERDVFFMTDATQAFGKIPIDVEKMNIDLLTCSAHKMYGPKGIGALYCRRSLPRVSVQPIIDGGGHERGLRSGTLNVPGIVGFAKAVEISLRQMKAEQSRLRRMRDKLYEELHEKLGNIKLNGHREQRLAGNLNICVPGVASEALIIALSNDVAISSGSACTTAAVVPSHVLKALGMSDANVHSSIRIGLGRPTTEAEVDYAAKLVAEEAIRIRGLRQA